MNIVTFDNNLILVAASQILMPLFRIHWYFHQQPYHNVCKNFIVRFLFFLINADSFQVLNSCFHLGSTINFRVLCQFLVFGRFCYCYLFNFARICSLVNIKIRKYLSWCDVIIQEIYALIKSQFGFIKLIRSAIAFLRACRNFLPFFAKVVFQRKKFAGHMGCCKLITLFRHILLNDS